MYLINKIEKKNKKIMVLIFAVLLCYTIIHFSYSGIYYPLKYSNLDQINEEIEPLIKFLQGNEFVFENPRQYGPAFILIILPFMLLHANKIFFYIALLLFNYILAGFSFYICYKYIFNKPMIKKVWFWSLLILWLNFSPLSYILGVKNVEIWELCLICLGFMLFIKKKYFWAGFSFAAGTLIKFLPGLFIIYFFFRNKRVFFGGIISLINIAILSHIIFGPNMGLFYFNLLFSNILQSKTWAVMFWENISLKSTIYKLMGGFIQDPANLRMFIISPEMEHQAFVIASVLQILVVLYIIWIALKKTESKEKIMQQFSLVSIAMLIISPVTAVEYCTLLLFAYSVGFYLILNRSLPKYMYLLYGLSYVLVGNFIPSSILIKIIPMLKLNSLLGITKLIPIESYKTLGFPLIGILLLGLFFIIVYHKKDTNIE